MKINLSPQVVASLAKLPKITIFEDPIHLPYQRDGGPQAALLVHGYSGTAANTRPMAEVLHQKNWAVNCLCLPGFGKQIEDLPRYHYSEWLGVVDTALTELKARYDTVLLVGHSMGGALSLTVAAENKPTGLFLLAPFWKLGPPMRPILHALSLLRPSIQPFRLMRANFKNPALRQELHMWMADADLDDPATQEALLNMRLPTSMYTQLQVVGQLGYRMAAKVSCPVCIVQGTEDPTVLPAYTDTLAARLPAPAQFVRITDHHNPAPGTQGWPVVSQTLANFADALIHA
jgi:esterase/lipase